MGTNYRDGIIVWTRPNPPCCLIFIFISLLLLLLLLLLLSDRIPTRVIDSEAMESRKRWCCVNRKLKEMRLFQSVDWIGVNVNGMRACVCVCDAGWWKVINRFSFVSRCSGFQSVRDQLVEDIMTNTSQVSSSDSQTEWFYYYYYSCHCYYWRLLRIAPPRFEG